MLSEPQALVPLCMHLESLHPVTPHPTTDMHAHIHFYTAGARVIHATHFSKIPGTWPFPLLTFSLYFLTSYFHHDYRSVSSFLPLYLSIQVGMHEALLVHQAIFTSLTDLRLKQSRDRWSCFNSGGSEIQGGKLF